MAADVLITFLPCEIIEYMLENDNLEISDILNFRLTCKYLNQAVITSNKLWRRKFFQRWPHLIEIYETEEKRGRKVSNWMSEVRASIQSRKKLMNELSCISQKYFNKQELSHSALNYLDVLFRPELGAHPLAYHFLVDELIVLLERPILDSNLTHTYYAYKIIRYLRQCYLTDEWEAFVDLPIEEQTLERGALLVSQWSQPEKRVSYSRVSKMLDDIATYTREYLRQSCPNHPIFSISSDKLNEWKDKNINDNQWNQIASRQIMDAQCKVMFEHMGFHGNSEMYYSSVNSFIDQVLENKRGIPITLAIIFESAARRLGVRCEPVSFPAHFLLRWKERYNIPESDQVESFYIDVFNGGQFLTKNSCPRVGGTSKCPIERYNIYRGASAVEVVQRMANNLEVAGRQRTQLNGRAARLRSALELIHLVRPYDTTAILHLARFYMHYQMDLNDLVQILITIRMNLDVSLRGQANHMLQMIQDYEKHMKVMPEEILQPKLRSPDIKYAIGMIMVHRIYGYSCVITGWDRQCEVFSGGMDEMGISELSDGVNQPFYNLFIDNGSSGYVAQENLIITTSSNPVDHDEIGRYFYKYCGTYYLPNEEKEKEYPEDTNIRSRLLDLCSQVF
ncbi:hypothetical protein PV325_000128 [Microctonus aethiopoides]|uniref:Hemimethylated DNA-binding domain-containing protein n=1 Tax=Microctonus aethiopoides TaxID=144406 RepID=A0AA39C7J9_9HYME|nr:hypothetical protein PV325_000128 [Microctonus aethiopoides]KAK0159019.1 hypothetical protein PV328_009951 [Microctonus aethiopoides]